MHCTRRCLKQLFFEVLTAASSRVWAMADPAVTPVPATKTPAEAERGDISVKGSEESAALSAGDAAASSASSASTGSSLLMQIHQLKAYQAALNAAKVKPAKDLNAKGQRHISSESTYSNLIQTWAVHSFLQHGKWS